MTVVPDRVPRAFNRSGPTLLVALDISKSFDRVWHDGLLRKPKSYERSAHMFNLISSFLTIKRICVVLDGKSSQELILIKVKLMLDILKALFLVLKFSYYTLMNFLMMLSLTLLSILMILLSTLSVIRHLIRRNNLNWLLYLNLIYETPWTEAASGLLIWMLEKLIWVCLTSQITLMLLMWK